MGISVVILKHEYTQVQFLPMVLLGLKSKCLSASLSKKYAKMCGGGNYPTLRKVVFDST